MKSKNIQIVKMTGEKEEFDQSKLKHSLERSGASDVVIQQVINEVEVSLYEGISTKEIYKTAFANAVLYISLVLIPSYNDTSTSLITCCITTSLAPERSSECLSLD